MAIRKYTTNKYYKQQKGSTICVPIALKNFLKYHNIDLPFDLLKIVCNYTKREGSSSVLAVKFLKYLGFKFKRCTHLNKKSVGLIRDASIYNKEKRHLSFYIGSKRINSSGYWTPKILDNYILIGGVDRT